MRLLLCTILLWTAASLPVLAGEENLSAAEIMRRVAANQDREQKERDSFVYEQHLRVVSRFRNGKLAREELADYLVTPSAKGSARQTIHIQGRYWKKKAYVEFKGEPVPDTDGIDGGLVSSFREDLGNNRSRDGMGRKLFPLTTEAQAGKQFQLQDMTNVHGRRTYRIRFTPDDPKDIAWAGEALIDADEFQPVSVFTGLSRRIPLFVRTMLGTDLPGLGFHTQYKRVDKDIWFPESLGSEFRIHAVFFINRTITVSLENKNFKRGTSQSEIHYQTGQ